MQQHKRILVVDDDARGLLVVEKILERMDPTFEIVGVKSAVAALQEARETHFDLMITDLHLPMVSGIALTRALRDHQSDLAVIWVTAYGCYQFRPQAKQLGICECLDKPWNLEELRGAVRNALEEIIVQ
ncbi:MAG: response regulator [Anaerolineae bacterium]|nr:response regulator [Anaerolineae bacterium]